MNKSKKGGPRLQSAPPGRHRPSQTRSADAAGLPHAAQFKPPARPNPAARPAAVQPKRPPAAPPAYRPQPAPKVLQKKTPQGQPAQSAQGRAQRSAQTPARPAAPPAYRPEPKPVLQPKAATPAHTPPKPQAPHARAEATTPPRAGALRRAALQMKPAAPPPARPRLQAPAPQPRVPSRPSQVVQRMEIDDDEMIDHYGEEYWPPPEKPPSTPPTPSYTYYKWSSSYYESQGEYDIFDEYVDFFNKNSGRKVGQTSGMGEEDEFDASYVDIPDTIRPSAPNAKALWNHVYNPLLQSQSNKSLVKVKCEELCGQWVYMDKKSKKEHGTTKRPPMCHIIPFNYIRWAADWVYANKNSPHLSKAYKGPDPKNYPADTWKKLVWSRKNLRAGHASCNSRTAHQAKTLPPPSMSDQKEAINYVIKKLHKLEPTWF